jgi:PAS domain S-box-containing protein
MEAPLENPAEEIKRLQRCTNDLVSILALPAIWAGAEPPQVVSTLLDALVGMLRLDFAYVRLNSSDGEPPFEMVRVAHSPNLTVSSPSPEISGFFNHRFRDTPERWLALLHGHIGDEALSFAPLRMGLQVDLGVIVAGSSRSDFPEQTERLVLSVAANQAAIGLQEARLLSEQKRVASELDRRVAERTRELAETNAQLQLQVGLLQHLPVSAWTLKPDGTPDFVNQVWLEFSGQTLDFVRSHPEAWMTAVHPEDRETATRAFWDGVHSGQGFAMEMRSLRARDGAYRWHLNRAVVLRDAEGTLLKFVGNTTDIDDQKRAEEKLRASESDLRQIFDNIPGLIGTLSPGGQLESVNRQVLEYFGKTLSLSDLQRNQVVLRTELVEDLPLVMGDRVQLQQVILNLPRNASDAMSGVDDCARQLVIESERYVDDSVCVTLRDTGTGIDPRNMDRLFDPFYTTKSSGMGMGLSVSRSII